jgi:hypothetical protein
VQLLVCATARCARTSGAEDETINANGSKKAGQASVVRDDLFASYSIAEASATIKGREPQMICSQQLLKRFWTLLIGERDAWKWFTGMEAQFLHLAQSLLKMVTPGDQMA